jgi:hypothetical protein
MGEESPHDFRLTLSRNIYLLLFDETSFSLDMGIILMTEESDAAQNRVGSSSAETAYTTDLHFFTQLIQQV